MSFSSFSSLAAPPAPSGFSAEALAAAPRFDLDQLYAADDRRRRESERLYIAVLRRAHAAVRHTNCVNRRLTVAEFVVPRVLQTAARYSWSECVAFCAQRLAADGFRVQLRAQNVLVLSWAHWIPADAREQVQRATGSSIDGMGNILGGGGSGGNASASVSVRPQQQQQQQPQEPAAARARVKPASALKFRPPQAAMAAAAAAAASAVYSDDMLEKTFTA
jgi:hypothetical protein